MSVPCMVQKTEAMPSTVSVSSALCIALYIKYWFTRYYPIIQRRVTHLSPVAAKPLWELKDLLSYGMRYGDVKAKKERDNFSALPPQDMPPVGTGASVKTMSQGSPYPPLPSSRPAFVPLHQSAMCGVGMKSRKPNVHELCNR